MTPEDRFVGEKYSIRYVASGRDLLRDAKPTAGPKTTMRVFANPDFGGIAAGPRLEQTNTVALRSVEMRDLEGISLPSLPGTEKESAKLEARAKKSGWQPQTYLGAKATEAELRKVNSPRILHLATHGFFLPEIDLGTPKRAGDAAEIPKGKLVNPMHRSGLALAGAQTHFASVGQRRSATDRERRHRDRRRSRRTETWTERGSSCSPLVTRAAVKPKRAKA